MGKKGGKKLVSKERKKSTSVFYLDFDDFARECVCSCVCERESVCVCVKEKECVCVCGRGQKPTSYMFL